MNVDTLFRGAVKSAIALLVALAAGVAYMLTELWPAAGPILAANALGVTAAGLLLRKVISRHTRELCDWLGDEVDARKLADQRDDVNFVRMQRAAAQRRAEVLPPIPMAAAARRGPREIVVQTHRHGRG